MLKKGPKQTKFLFSPLIYSKLIPANHFLRKLDKYIDWSQLEAVILPLYCEDNGRPVTNIPRRMFKAEILQYLYDWRDREIVEHARYNIVVKWFLELGLDEEPFDFTALSKLRAKLGIKLHTELFLDILRQIDAAGFLDSENQFIDATSILGDVAVCSTTQLISRACLHFARKLEEEGHPVSFEEEKKESLQKTVEKALHLLETAVNIPEAEHEREILKSIVSDYTECNNGIIAERKKKGEGRIVSVTDEDVRWGAKSDKKTWPGYKLHNTMTENRIITSVTVTPANVTDDKEAPSLFEQQEKKPETLTGDGLYGTGENRQYFKEEGCHLIAPLRGQENKTKLYPKAKFSWDGTKVTCPQGKTTSTFYDNKRARCYLYRFKGSDCQVCPVKSHCTTGPHRTIAISYYQSLFDEAAEFNKTDLYKDHMKKRAHIEPKYSEMKHSHGLERARYRGLDRVTIQALLTAIVVNLKNLIRLLTEAKKKSLQRELSIPHG
jgi:transposase